MPRAPSIARLAGALACLCLPATADVHVFGKPFLGVFREIQAAADAAADGDVLLIEAGDYAGFTLDGKGLSLFPLSIDGSVVRGGIEIRNLPAASSVLLVGLAVAPPDQGASIHALWIDHCQGLVQASGCSFRGALYKNSGPTSIALCGAGVRADYSPRVAFSRCELLGRDLSAQGHISQTVVVAGHGLDSYNSRVALYDCTLRGGGGHFDSNQIHACEGGAGARTQGWYLFASGSTFQGGNGGAASPIWCQSSGPGGDGIHAVVTEVTQLGGSLLPGNGGPAGWNCENGLPGVPFDSFGASLIVVPQTPRRLDGPIYATDNAPLKLVVHGEPGDDAWVLLATQPAFLPYQDPLGIALLARPWLLPLAPMQTLDAEGQGLVTFHFGDLQTAGAGWVFHLQALVVAKDGFAALSGAVHVLVTDT